MENRKVLEELPANDGYEACHNEVLSRIGYLYVDCPECECVDDDQYQCGLCCSVTRQIHVATWIKENY